MSQQGLSLIEILIAITILSVGIIPIAVMQTNALKANQTATIVKELTHLAESEITARQNKVDKDITTCSASLAGASCQVAVEECTFTVATNTLTCAPTSSPTDAYKISVSASYKSRSLSLMTMVKND